MTVYIVQQLDWEYNDTWWDMTDDTPVKAFASHSDAEAYCQQREAEQRNHWSSSHNSPLYAFGGIERCTTGVTDALFLQRAHAAGLPTPGEKIDSYDGTSYLDYASWWRTLTGEQQSWVWEQLDRVRFYEVVSLELEP
jgi:hypothetical protein